jgi:hypothetical protein
MNATLRTAALVLVTTLAIGCAADLAERANSRDTRLPHGFEVKDKVAVARVICTDSISRIVGDPGVRQLVTFVGPDACDRCDRHVSGVELAMRENAWPIEELFVAFAPPAELVQFARLRQSGAAPPICLDTAGVLWRNLKVAHTPVTALIARGRIAYLNDRFLDQPAERRWFVEQVRASLGREP